MSDPKVVQVTVVNRHGDRVPLDSCGPNANQPCVIPNDKVDWYSKFGLAGGQLTGVGMDQCFGLGTYLAKKYVPSLLDSAFKSHMVRSWSTPVDRTLMSEWLLKRSVSVASIPCRPVYKVVSGSGPLLSPGPLTTYKLRKRIEDCHPRPREPQTTLERLKRSCTACSPGAA
jgi:hypothetical protein